MNMCLDCEKQFEEPKEEIIIHFEVDTRREEIISVCPNCGSSDYEEMGACLCCGEPIGSSEDYCNSCLDFANEAIEQFSWKMASFEKNTNKLLLYVLESED